MPTIALRPPRIMGWWCVASELRQLRRSLGVEQREFATLLGVPAEAARAWDSGRRAVPIPVLQRARRLAATGLVEPGRARSDSRSPPCRQEELLTLDVLASEFGIHQRTLRDAVRAGRLTVEFSKRSAFGRPIRLTTRSAVSAYKK